MSKITLTFSMNSASSYAVSVTFYTSDYVKEFFSNKDTIHIYDIYNSQNSNIYTSF